MDWNQKLSVIIEEVETHLQEKEEAIAKETITAIAGCSYDFFLKVFSYMNGISFAEYVRYRKLTLAGYDVKSTAMKIVDISYTYGYDSPTSFTKAFQQFHGVSPSQARANDALLRVYPKMQTTSSSTCSWQLVQKSAMRMVGVHKELSKKANAHAQGIPAYWHQCQCDGTFVKLVALDEGQPQGLFGIFEKEDSEKETLTYAIMAVSDAPCPPGFFTYTIPACTWAIFDCHGFVPQAIQKGWQFLYEEWLLKYPFAHAPYAEMEWYSSTATFSEDYLSQIWIPIIEKT